MGTTGFILLFVGVFVGGLVAYNRRGFVMPVYRRKPDRDFPHQWRKILGEKIAFYQRLSPEDKGRFEYKVHMFLLNVRVIGVQTEITDTDRMLVASSAVIPIFGFPEWHYVNLHEVHIHPDRFPIPGTDKYARGLIGWGSMDGLMKLSRKALFEGFFDQNDQKNVAIHEFIHIIDKQDGEVDGVLDSIMDEVDIMPWLQLMHQKTEQIKQGRSDIRDYGAVNRGEFFAVVSEYFFESPEQMKIEHPALYTALDSIFNPKKAPKSNKFEYTKKYDPCPCGSGRKYSRCCLKNSSFSY